MLFRAGIEKILSSRAFFMSIRSSCFVALGLSMVFLAGCKPQSTTSSQSLEWRTLDGTLQQGTLYIPENPSPPALLLVHGVGGSRSEWDSFALRAQDRGFLCLAFDLRGHGESVERNGRQIAFREFSSGDWISAIADLERGKQQLIEAGADPENIFIIGSSIGANISIRYGSQDAQIQGVVALSPGMTYRGVGIEDTITENRRMPLLLLAAEGDTFSSASVKTLTEKSPAYIEQRTYLGSSHGTNLMANNEQVVPDILQWIQPILKK